MDPLKKSDLLQQLNSASRKLDGLEQELRTARVRLVEALEWEGNLEMCLDALEKAESEHRKAMEDYMETVSALKK